jgi:iron complex outermembrane receptor protein
VVQSAASGALNREEATPSAFERAGGLMKLLHTELQRMIVHAVLFTCASLGGLAAPATAQELRTAAAEHNKTAAGGLEEVVVTAQKREENLQSVPIAVSAVTGDSIEKLHANSLLSLSGTVPSIQINHHANTPNTAVFYIRGIGIIEPDPYAGNTVSIVVDDVPQFYSMGALLDLFDVERVEVLRGPQGTLFGANTTGGVVNVVTRQPTGKFGGRFELTYGKWDRLDVRGALDFPLIEDTLAGKVVVSHTQRSGWIRNAFDGRDLDSRDVTAVRGYLKLTPGDRFDATLMAEVVAARNGSPVVVNGGIAGEALYVAPGSTAPGSKDPMYASPCSAGAPCKAPNEDISANDSTRDVSDMDTDVVTLRANWRETALGDLTSITAYKKFRLFEETDQDGTPFFLLDTRRATEGWQLSQELRSSANLSESINVIYGAFYMKTHYEHLHRLRVQFAVPGLHQENPQDQDNYSASVFAQTYFNFTERLRLQAGVRYAHEQTEMTAGTLNFIDPSGIAQFEGGIPVGGFMAHGKKSWDNVGGKLGLDYQMRAQTLLYGYWARGFKSGGFVGRVGIPQDIGPYEPEKVDTFEVGLKGDWLERRVRTNLAIFYTDYKDMQLSQNYFAPDTGGGFVQGNTILNVASSEIKGVELDASVVPTEGLTLNASVAYLDAKYKNFPFTEISVIGVTVRDLSGYRLQNSPEWAGSASVKYEQAAGPGTLAASLLYTYIGKKYLTSLVDSARATIQPTHYVNANLDWSPNGDRWTVGLWARNLLDKRYLQNVFDAPGTFAFVSYAPPREYGVTVNYTF